MSKSQNVCISCLAFGKMKMLGVSLGTLFEVFLFSVGSGVSEPHKHGLLDGGHLHSWL